MIPKEGSDLWVDTMVVMEASENKAAAYAFIDYILRPEVGQVDRREHALQDAERRGDGRGRSRGASRTIPTLAITPAELFEQEAQTDLGEEGTILWTEAATEIKA